MTANIEKLKSLASRLEAEINNIDKSLSTAEKEKSGVKVGVDYFMNRYSSSDPDLIAFMSAKREQAVSKLEPLLKRLSVLDELAAETIKTK